jgi:putative FmdB family regulatory protein
MVYEYRCDPCQYEFEVVKNAKYYDSPESCPKCGDEAVRLFRPKIHLKNTSVQEKYFDHSLGVITTKDGARDIAKRRGLVEVGNERPEKHLKVHDDDYSDV